MSVKERSLIFVVLVLLLVTAAGGPVLPLQAEVAPTPADGAIAQPNATVSGTIRRADNNNPVSGVDVSVHWDGGSQTVTTGAGGTYSVSGVPTGGRVQIHVRPAIADRLAFRNWGTDSLAGDLVKDFYLQNGYRLQGEFRQPDGSLYAETFWLAAKGVGFSPPSGEWVGDTVLGGQFDMVLPRDDVYLLELNSRPLPYFMPLTKVDLSHDVTGLVITLLDTRPAPFPTTPPLASAIQVGTPDVDGHVAITGTAGAVEPLSAVLLVNLNAGNITTATADAAGGFHAAIYAPPGSTLMVKYDPEMWRVHKIWQDSLAFEIPDIVYVTPLPGTALPTNPAPRGVSTIPFRTTGSFRTEKPTTWAGWALEGEIHLPPGTAVSPGDWVDFDAQIRITSPALQCTEPVTLTPQMNVHLRYLFDADGHSDPWGIWFNAHNFTPTGLPIEHEAYGERPHVVSAPFGGLQCDTQHTVWGSLESQFQIPANLPDGTYLLDAFIEGGGVPLAPNLPIVTIWNHHHDWAGLPPLTVGTPIPPRIPWTLLGDYPINGHRGVPAREDEGHFAMPTRVLYPPHQAVVPRLNERTGEPRVYRLEPGSAWLSNTDRRLPNPPRIPLAFPTGELYVEVHKPDGSVDILGPAPIRQSSARTPTTPGGTYLDFGTGHVGDIYHLTTMEEDFGYRFEQDGHHVIILEGTVEDVYGNTYAIDDTYDVFVGRVLDLDPAQLPTMPYEQGNAFAPGLHVFPPVPAQVEVRLVHMPYSDPAQAIETVVAGQANRFGYFQPPAGTAITMTAPGEFRVDVTAVYTDPDGTRWQGAVTWGNVVEGPGAQIVAHGRRGMDYKSNTIDDMPAWFNLEWLLAHPSKQGIEVYYPYFSGDIHWGDELSAPVERKLGNSIHSIITVEDVGGIDGPIYNLLRAEWPARNGFRWPPVDITAAGLESRLEIGEAPLFMSTYSGIDPGVDPSDIDLMGYWYASSQRPDVRVREILSEDDMGTAYWRFDDTYGYQIGESAEGDLPGDIKWEFGGAVLRYLSQTDPINEYAIYSSFWVLLPHDDPTGVRITPPFRGAGALNGGPIMELAGEEIDMLFLPKGVRPGDVLEVGDVVSFSGHVGPPLDSRVEVVITAPSGAQHPAVLRANTIGWVYDPGFDFPAYEPGRWTVDVYVEHDRPYEPTGFTPTDYNTGTVLGTQGRYEFYVVEPGTPRVGIISPEPGFLTWPGGHVEPVFIRGFAPPGTTAVHYTIHDKGVVMGQDVAIPDAGGAFTITYDAVALNGIFPFVSLTAHEGEWEGLADEVSIHMLAVGEGEPRATTVTLIGEEVFLEQYQLPHRVYLPVTLKE